MKKLLSILLITLGCSGQKPETSERRPLNNESVDQSTVSIDQDVIPTEDDSPSSISTLTMRNVLQRLEILIPKAFNIMDDEMME